MNHEDKKAQGAESKTQRKAIDQAVERTASVLVDSAFLVHSALGPGLLESVYETCLSYECEQRGLKVLKQVQLPIRYRDLQIDSGLRLDLLVEEHLIVELKAVESLLPVHHAQLLSYLKLTGLRLGLLINFNVPLIKHGIHRIIL